jgi:hypothetical protein
MWMDMLLIGNNREIIQDVKTQLSSKFDMKDLGAANFILGMEIKRDRKNWKIWLNHRKYVETILQRFNMQECKLVRVPYSCMCKVIYGLVSLDTGRGGGHVSCSICECGWKLDVCNGLY